MAFLNNFSFRKITVFLCLLLSANTTLSAQSALPSTDIYLLDIKLEKGKYSVSNPKKITDWAGYDNQPFFLPDNQSLFYTSIREDKQADVYRYDIKDAKTTQITKTPEDEYSPTVMPDRSHFSSVRVEKDSAQRLWKFSLNGTNPELINVNVDNKIGYHAWIDENRIAMFILGDTFTLQTTDLRTNKTQLHAKNIGRCVLKIPAEEAVSFVSKQSEKGWIIQKLDLKSGIITDIISTLPESEDYLWTKDGTILTGSAGQLYKFTPGKDKNWIQIADFKGTDLENFYRIVISPDGSKLALVSFKGKKP